VEGKQPPLALCIERIQVMRWVSARPIEFIERPLSLKAAVQIIKTASR